MVTVLTVAALMETDWRQKAGKDDLSQKAPAPISGAYSTAAPRAAQ